MSAPHPDEITALREGAAICTHDLRAIIRLTGADLLPWLERIGSNPVTELADGDVVRTTLMDGKGKLRGELRLLATTDPGLGLMADVPRSIKANLLRLLDMYIINDDVQVTDVDADWRFVSLLGPTAREVAASAGLPWPDEGRLARVGEGVYVVGSDLAGLPGIDLVMESEWARDVVERLFATGAPRASVEALDVVRVGQGVPWFDRDLADGVIPLEAHLADRVSITKGCYPGQEVVARILNLGQVARKLVRLQGPGSAALQPGTELLGTGDADGKTVGVVTSVVHDPTRSTTEALGYVRRSAWTSGTQLRGGEAELVVTSLSGDD